MEKEQDRSQLHRENRGDGKRNIKRKREDPGSSDKRQTNDTQHSVVAQHYNQLPEMGKRQRLQSKIYYMRNFNNWVKSVLMRTFQIRLRDEGQRGGILALDLGCGKGGDLLKWGKGNVRKVVCTDIASTSIAQCKDRYESNKRKFRGSIFDAEFIVADSSKQRLSDLYKQRDQQFDLVSSQFVVHYSFESEEQANLMFQNACESLRKGGYFIGTTVNSQELRKRLDYSDDNAFGNSIYSVTFDSKDDFKDFGHKYDFHLDGVVDCPEFVAKKEMIVKLAAKYGMRLVFWKTFSDFFALNSRDRENKDLLKKIKALEFFPSQCPNGTNPGDYNHAKDACDDIIKEKPGSRPRVGTLSLTEWDAASLYVAFAFKKIESEDEHFEVEPSDCDSIPLLVLSL